MTIDERASDVARLITRRIIAEGRLFATNLGEFDAAQDAIAIAIREAVAEEREACALIADRRVAEENRGREQAADRGQEIAAENFRGGSMTAQIIARQIRDRASTHPEHPPAANPPPQPPRPSDRE